MRFEGWFCAGIQDGTVTVTFRRWKRPQAVAGRRYRNTAGMIEVDAVDVVDESAITDAEARPSPTRPGVLARGWPPRP